MTDLEKLLVDKLEQEKALLWAENQRYKTENATLRKKLELLSNNQTDEYICVDREHGLWKRKDKTL